jgi:hypothetical protein
MSSKRQTTIAKMNRERAVKERRARKQEKKEARHQAALDAANGEANGTAPVEGEAAPAEQPTGA